MTFLEKYPNRGVAYKGSISKKQLNEIIPSYQASIVPLVKSIKGAVPSKIFELMQFQIPIIFCGGGEGAKIINQYKIGFNVLPGDLNNLKKVITDISNMTQSDLMKLKENCRIAISTDFSFELQLTKLIDILS